jgi:hypothetical protein
MRKSESPIDTVRRDMPEISVLSDGDRSKGCRRVLRRVEVAVKNERLKR